MKAWLDSGGDPDTQDSGGLGETLLFYAAAAGDCDTINLLMSRGASVDWRGYNGRTSLTTAVFGDFRRAALCLLIDAHGANVNARDDTGRTPLHEAAQQARAHGLGVRVYTFAPLARPRAAPVGDAVANVAQ